MVTKKYLTGNLIGRIAKPASIVFAVLFVLSLIGLIAVSSLPTQIKQETALVSYQKQGTFDYLVYLKPSYLFGPAPQQPQVSSKYPLALVDSIGFTFRFSPAAAGSSDTRIEAVLENPGIWQKTLSLASNSGSGNILLPFTLDIQQAQSIFEDIEKGTGVTGQQRDLSIRASVQIAGQTFIQKLPITINNGLVEIDNSNLQQDGTTGTGTLEYLVNPKTSITVPPASAKYPAAIADRIDLTHSYTGLGQNTPSKISVDAVLENPGIWKKTLPLVMIAQKTGDVRSVFSLDLKAINEEFDTIEKALNIAAGGRNLTVQATVTTAGGNFVQNLPIILNSTVIEVDGNLTGEQLPLKAKFDYSVHLTDDTLFGTDILTPPESVTTGVPVLLDAASLHSPAIPPKAPAVTQGPGNDIYAKLLDKMNLNFNYKFQSNQPVTNQAMDVMVFATIEAPQVWSKNFTLLQTNKDAGFKINIPLDIAGYMDLIQNIGTETGNSPGAYNFTITANVHTTGDTKFGKIDDVYTQSLKGSLKSGVLQWDKELTKTQPGSISTTKVIPNDNKYLGLSISSAKSTALILAFIFLVLTLLSGFAYFRSRPSKAAVNEAGKEARQIQKKHGSRLIEASGDEDSLYSEATEIINLNSMDDLIKVSDELGKPVLHRTTLNGCENHVYEVADSNLRYRYLLKNNLEESGSQEKKQA